MQHCTHAVALPLPPRHGTLPRHGGAPLISWMEGFARKSALNEKAKLASKTPDVRPGEHAGEGVTPNLRQGFHVVGVWGRGGAGFLL